MRPITLLSLLTLLFCINTAAFAAPADPKRSMSQLKKEISVILHQQDLTFLRQPVETVTVEFLINARNEIVVLHVEGQNDHTCDKIRDILAHQPVKYKQARQLMRYKVDLRLVQ
jgi:hypothetical protein